MGGTRPGRLLLAIAFLGFISLGLPDAVIGVAWPGVRDTFGLPQSGMGLVLLAAGCGYFLSSFCAGRLIERMGIGLLLAGSSGLVAASGFGFAAAPVWLAFIACSLLHGLGSGAIDGGLNSYAASNLTARQMNWLHACYCLGAMLGPLLMTGVIAQGNSWRAGYASIGAIMLLLSLLFTATRRRWSITDQHASQVSESGIGLGATLKHRAVRLQMLLFFVYTGLEVSVGQWTFTLFTEFRKIDAEAAGLWVSGFWASIAVGRILFGLAAERLGIDRLLRLSTVAALLGSLLFAAPWAALPQIGLILLGLALAPVYPCLMTRTPQRLGSTLARHAIGFQVSAAMIGGAVLPSLVGLLADALGLATVAWAVAALAFCLLLLHEILLHLKLVVL